MSDKIKTILAIIIGSLTILGSAYGGFKFYSCKADRAYVEQIKELKADKVELELVKADFYIYKLQQRRKYVQERIWDIQRTFPHDYMNRREYRDLVQELKQLDIEINAYYNKGK